MGAQNGGELDVQASGMGEYPWTQPSHSRDLP